ncbi:MAG: hypothetical protein E7236_06430 [Lachnospiraceae bacterium]|nr:hypothetical protein [Lachnospiraceae bacterium]
MAKNKAETPGMKLCKHCQTEIPKAAKICPNCKKKQSRKGLIALLVIIIIIVLLIIAGAVGGSDDTKSETTVSTETVGEPTETEGTQIEEDTTTMEETVEPEETIVEEVEPELTEEDYKSECEEIGYKDLARTPDDYAGSKITVTGEIMQVQESGSEAIYLMNITEDEYGFWEDLVWINAPLDQNNRYLEEDIVQIWGEYQGIRTYSTVLSAENSVPEINAEYLELIE